MAFNWQSMKVCPGYQYQNEKTTRGSCLQNESMPRTTKTVRKYDVVKSQCGSLPLLQEAIRKYDVARKGSTEYGKRPCMSASLDHPTTTVVAV